jgi:hypothetical protein
MKTTARHLGWTLGADRRIRVAETSARTLRGPRMAAKLGALIGLSLACGCLGTGHVYRGVHAQAALDLDCPSEKVEVQGLDAMHERFRATGCGREARYMWVEGKAVRDGTVHAQAAGSGNASEP